MADRAATRGLIFNEPLLWEKGKTGRCAMSIPESDVPRAPLPENCRNADVRFPDLAELDVVRHYTRLSQWNFSIDSGMYPLGSCSMKYNPKLHERLAASPSLANSHPMLEDELSQGSLRLLYELQEYLKSITGMSGVSLQPAAGAQGELAGMLMFARYFKVKGEQRSKILIPDTAHGTNPASAALCGFKPVAVKSGTGGTLSVERVAALMDEQTAGIMITNPNTLGIFESEIQQIAEVVHSKGGLVYGDGANMNAVMGIVDIARTGVDVMHLNLHKTFSTPHGGGGPGAGPVLCVEKLAPFLPSPRAVRTESGYAMVRVGDHSIGRLHAFHGNYSVLIRAYGYVLSMGAANLKKASQLAVLNANYVKACLKDVLHLPYDSACMHECVFSDKYLQKHKVMTIDLAKRLIDYGYHPPTIYFPLIVSGAIMIEPTESECKDDIDGFIEAVKAVVDEAENDPEKLHDAPGISKVRRLDETQAARKPCLIG
jgi:glycine dehydrogenase subunit 2